MLNPGDGPISAVALYVPAGAAAPTHLFSGGVDGTLAIWSAGRTWDCLKVMPTHLLLECMLFACQGHAAEELHKPCHDVCFACFSARNSLQAAAIRVLCTWHGTF